jgi:cation transport regulator ChaC
VLVSATWARLMGPPDEQVWYFAYGSNMNDSVFRGWRSISPLEWRAGHARGYRLRFNLEGWPRGRAAPANLEPHPQAEVWGVLYGITRRDLVRLDASEGTLWWRYRQLWLDAEDAEGNTLRAVTYIAQGDEIDRRPSLRCITSLREGARAMARPSTTSVSWRGLNTRDSPVALMAATSPEPLGAPGSPASRPSCVRQNEPTPNTAGHRARDHWKCCRRCLIYIAPV